MELDDLHDMEHDDGDTPTWRTVLAVWWAGAFHRHPTPEEEDKGFLVWGLVAPIVGSVAVAVFCLTLALHRYP